MKSGKKFRFWLLLYIAIGCAVSLVIAALYVLRPSVLAWADGKVYDAYLKYLPKTEPSDITVIVDIDEKSLAERGQWPWPRYLMASLVGNLTEDGAAAIGLDILLSEMDRTSPEAIRKELTKTFGLEVDFNGLPEFLENNDKLFAEYLAASPTVLGIYVGFGKEEEKEKDFPPGLKTAVLASPDAASPEKRLIKGESVSSPLKIFYDAAPVGVINAVTDGDGIIRRIPLIMGAEKDGKDILYGNLALRALMRAYEADTALLKTGPDGLYSINFRGLSIPVGPDGTFPLLFKGPGRTYKYISASDVLSRNYDPAEVAGKIIFVGSSAPGLLDIRTTPLDSYYPGVEMHAAAVDAMISGSHMSIPSWGPGFQIILIILTGLGISVLAGKLPPFYSIPAAFLLVACFWAAGYKLFEKGLFVSPFFISLAAAASVFSIVAVRFLSEAYERKALKNTFSRYVSPEVVSQIADRGFDLFAGEEKEVTAIFTDIRGFTSLAENLKPQDMVTLLNRYFAPMTDLIRSHKGTLDKFIGDAIMAFWNAPVDVPDHPYKAVSAALAMFERLEKINEELKADYGVTLRIGAGVNTGNVYVGNMGSLELINYTIIGDNVNLASRLEGLCPKFGAPLICSETTAEACRGRFAFQPVDNIRVKGKSRALEVFYAMTLEEGEKRKEELERYSHARFFYTEGRFSEGKTAFEALLKDYPETSTRKLYEIYLERCLKLVAKPPEEWTGVWVFDTK